MRSATVWRVAIVISVLSTVSRSPVCAGDGGPQAGRSLPEFVAHRVGTARYEPCGVGDFNKDGRLDIVSGPILYLAPDWKEVRIRSVDGSVDEKGDGYYHDFMSAPLDVDGDGLLDVVSCDWFCRCIEWHRNPGDATGEWETLLVEKSGNHECGDLVDIDGDGKALEILVHVQPTVWWEVGKLPDGTRGLVKHVISDKPLDYGAGVGDVNGDGRPDVLRPSAWYEAPADPRKGPWKEHPLAVGHLEEGKADHTPQILVTDVNDDGRNDIVTSSAHGWGIFWYEQLGGDGSPAWKQHLIDRTSSQAHALTLADLDDDGDRDLVAGKRFRAHNGGDPGASDPLVVCWYELEPGPEPKWTRHDISRGEGIGAALSIPVIDLDGDGDLDIVVSGKWGGPVWFENTSEASGSAWIDGGPAPPAPDAGENVPRPSILFLLADQWRAQATGYAGNPDVKTPHLDRLATEGVRLTNAISGCPVCSPYRGSLLTGQRPLTHGVFMNDVQLPADRVTIAEVLKAEGYDTAYIGKWHLDGRGRSSFIPRERRQGFDYWKVLECTHSYNRSFYYGDENVKRQWEGYDAIAQTRDAQGYLEARAGNQKPFVLFVSWGPPHAPYHTAPERYRKLYDPTNIHLRPNVPEGLEARVRKDLAGYYAHCTALDDCVGELRGTLEKTGLERNTIVVFTSDHGDLLGSHAAYKKQQLYEESIRVPLLLYHPKLETLGEVLPAPINTEDLMPTLLGLCKVKIPSSVEGIDYSGYLRGGTDPSDGAALITCPQPFGQWPRRRGGKEFRAVRTARYTYACDLEGPWVLFDNRDDPYQQRNLVEQTEYAELRARLDRLLQRKLRATGDEFLPGLEYVRRRGYVLDKTETVPYRN